MYVAYRSAPAGEKEKKGKQTKKKKSLFYNI